MTSCTDEDEAFKEHLINILRLLADKNIASDFLKLNIESFYLAKIEKQQLLTFIDGFLDALVSTGQISMDTALSLQQKQLEHHQKALEKKIAVYKIDG